MIRIETTVRITRDDDNLIEVTDHDIAGGPDNGDAAVADAVRASAESATEQALAANEARQ